MRVRVRVPATSANLGPGFDALGLALALDNEVTLEEADGVSVAVEGEGSGRLDEGAKNIVARGAALAFEIAGRAFPGARLRCVNRIPLSRGLGSSAAAWVGGLLAANAIMGEPLDRDALLAAAARAEGHPDNVAAAILAALSAGRAELLALAMQDRLHQPYRLRLFPWMDAVATAGREAGALGCVLSGAGPAMLAAVRRHGGESIARAMERSLRGAGIEGRTLHLPVDASGATWERLPQT